MKLREIYITCKNNQNYIRNFSAKRVSINGRDGFAVEGWMECLTAIQHLKKIPSLNEVCDDLVAAIPFVYITKKTFNVSVEEWSKINTFKLALLRAITTIVNLCESMGILSENQVGMDIKLPIMNDFADFSKCINELEFIFTKCTFLQTKDETIKFENVDVGSTWLTFSIVGVAAITAGSVILNNMAALVDKSIILRSHYLTVKKQKMELEQEQRNQDEKRVILSYIDGMYKSQVDEMLFELEKCTGIKIENRDGDERSRNRECIEKLGKLVEQGLQIYASIGSPNENKKLFEPLEVKYLSIAEDIKLLQNKDEE